MFMHANRSKRSIAVNLKARAGLDVALRLAARSDILIYNIRPQAMERLGLGYEAVAAVNPGSGLSRYVRLRPGRALRRPAGL